METNTGPLGHGFPVAVGIALSARLQASPRRTFVVLGDGELQEGSNWEAAMTAAHYGLSALTAIVDRNRLQQGARTEETKQLEPLDLAGQVGDLAVVDITYPFNPPGLPASEVAAALKRNNLRAIGITPEVYTREFCRGAFTNPDPAVRARAIELVLRAADVARELGCDYVKLWPGQDGHDYPFQVDHGQIWSYAVTGLRSLAQARPEMKFAIEYKPREPRVSMFFSSAAKTLLAIEDMDVGNVGILLDFGHSLYGGESPAEAARLINSRGLLYAIDVNDNFRGWDDDLIVGSVHLTETLEFFHTLRECGWKGVWQLDQFPFREDSVEAAREGITTMRSIHRALDLLDVAALRDAQARQDALAANKIARQALLSCEPR